LFQNEIETKKTFIRYISHEIRSPLSTTSLGLDYLLDQFASNPEISTKEVHEVVRDAKITCEIATSTLNDLLMFDKMETGMLQATKVECNARDFVLKCVRPFQLQVSI
jgi:signal transduction histidine kinase